MFFEVAICRKIYSEVCIIVNNLHFMSSLIEATYCSIQTVQKAGAFCKSSAE